MTATLTGRTIPPPTPEQLAARAERRERLAALVASAPKILREVTTEAVYDVVPPVPLPDSPRDRLIVRITVRVTRPYGPGSSKVQVLAEHRARNATNGQPRRNGPEWIVVSESVAADLILRALR